MRKFKNGDRIKMKCSCSGCVEGGIYEIFSSTTQRPITILKKLPNGGMDFGCACQRYWVLINDINVRELNKNIVAPKHQKTIDILEQKLAELTAKQ